MWFIREWVHERDLPLEYNFYAWPVIKSQRKHIYKDEKNKLNETQTSIQIYLNQIMWSAI